MKYDTGSLSSMLRDELAAVEIYDKSIPIVADSAVRTELERIRGEHQQAVGELDAWVRDLHGKQASSSPAWGFFAALVTSTAAVLGVGTLLAALRRGERHGETIYRHGLGNPDFPDKLRHLVGSSLLPRCQEHAATLERLGSQIADPSHG